MAEQELSQKDLEALLAKDNAKVSDDKAEEMKENILKESSGQSWLGLGVHEVFIKSVELTQAKTGTLGMKIVVENPDGKNEVTFWLSEAALPYSIENVSRLVVHNTAEDKRAAVREFFGNIMSAKELVEVAKEKLVGGVGYLSVRESKTQTYTDKNGEVKPSLERNLLPYKPKETATQSVAKEMGGGTLLDEKTKLDIPFE